MAQPANTTPTFSPEDVGRNSSYATLLHLSSLSAIIGVPFGALLGPLVLWLIKRQESRFVDANGRNALNFQITFAILNLVIVTFVVLVFLATFASAGSFEPPPAGFAMSVVGWTFVVAVIVVLLVLVNVIFSIVGGVRASNGIPYEYPLAIRFFKPPLDGPVPVRPSQPVN